MTSTRLFRVSRLTRGAVRMLAAVSLVAGGALGLAVVNAAPAAAEDPLPSDSFCPTPYQTISDGETLGVRHRLVLQMDANLQNSALCYRVASGNTSVGGAIVFDAPFVGIPSTDSDLSGCWNVITDQILLNQRLFVALGGDSTETWVCVQYGSTQMRLRVPLLVGDGVKVYADEPIFIQHCCLPLP